MFTRVGRSPFVFVSFIRCTPALWAWGSTLVPECKTRPMQPGYVTCVDSVVGVGHPQRRAMMRIMMLISTATYAFTARPTAT